MIWAENTIVPLLVPAVRLVASILTVAVAGADETDPEAGIACSQPVALPILQLYAFAPVLRLICRVLSLKSRPLAPPKLMLAGENVNVGCVRFRDTLTVLLTEKPAVVAVKFIVAV